MTKRLIEEWLPIAALGEESMRERRSMTALPPIYYLHVWWARGRRSWPRRWAPRPGGHIREVVAHLQPPPHTLADLEAILDRPEWLPTGCHATRIGTCDPRSYEDSSDNVELWVPGSPLFPLVETEVLPIESERAASRIRFLQALMGASSAVVAGR